MNIDTIRARAEAIDRRSRRQDMASTAAFSLIIIANAIAAAFHTSTVEKLGDLWSVAAAVYVLSYYWRAREAPPAALGEMPSIEFCRRDIVRRRAMVRGMWKVALLFLPAFLLNDSFVSPQPPARYVTLALGLAFLIVLVEWLNRREARRLERELHAIAD